MESLCAVHGDMLLPSVLPLPLPSLCQLPASYVVLHVSPSTAAAALLHLVLRNLFQHLQLLIAAHTN